HLSPHGPAAKGCPAAQDGPEPETTIATPRPMMFGRRNPNRNGSSLLSKRFALGQASEPSAGTMTIAARCTIRKSCDRLGRPPGLPKHRSTALKSALY
ncbi:MAG TPA: hypothetical protein VIJ63_20905, partial [Roseiarcus sp.]